MKTALLDLQYALFTRLSNDSTLNTEITGLFDKVPDNQPMPYAKLGNDTSIRWNTKTFEGEEATHTLHVWSDKSSKAECKRIMNLILASLSEPLQMGNGFSIEMSNVDFMQVLEDPEGYFHGVLTLRFKIKH